MIRLHVPALLALLLAPSACTQFPALDHAATGADRDAAYPELVPFDRLRVPPPERTESARAHDTLAARRAALEARAARLRGAVIDPATRRRMAGGVPQG